MTKLLLVEDDAVFREQLEFCLAQRGHEVRTASNGRAAIDVGCSYRPDVLVTDWLLNDSIHGLHVAEALRAISPATRVILITGFPSHDLQDAARAATISRILEKPFAVEKLDQLVREVAASPSLTESHLPIPVAEFDARGMLVYGNQQARRLFAAVDGAARSGQVPLPLPTSAQLEAAVGVWIGMGAAPTAPWQMRSRRLGSQGWLAALRPAGQSYLENLPVVRMLLGIQEPVKSHAAFSRHTLIVARDAVVRQVIGNTLATLGCVFHSAHALNAASRLLRDDPQVGAIVLHGDGFDHLDEFIDQSKALRPRTLIVRCDAVEPADDTGDGTLVNLVLEMMNGRVGLCDQCRLPVYFVQLDRTPETADLRRCSCAG